MDKPRRGRKPIPEFDYTDKILEEISVLAGRLTDDQICSYYGIKKDAWYKSKRTNEKLDAAVMAGRSKTINFVASKLLEAIKKGNIPATIFFLKCKAGWREVDRPEDGKGGSDPIPPITLTMDATTAAKIYQQVMTRS